MFSCKNKDELNKDLLEAVKNNDIGKVSELIDDGADLSVIEEKGFKRNSLIIATEEGNKKMVSLLVEKGANINGKSGTGTIAIIESVKNGDLGMVKFLLDKGANINGTDSMGSTTLIKSSEKGYEEIASELIEKGANINGRNNGGFTAIMSATMHGHYKIVTFLKEKNAVFTKEDKERIKSSVKFSKSMEKLLDKGKSEFKKVLDDILK